MRLKCTEMLFVSSETFAKAIFSQIFTCFTNILPRKFKLSLIKNPYKPLSIMKTCPYNIYPLKPHFYIAKLGYARVYLFFLFLLQIRF